MYRRKSKKIFTPPSTFLLEDGLLSPEHQRCMIKSGILFLPLCIAFLGKVLPLLHHSWNLKDGRWHSFSQEFFVSRSARHQEHLSVLQDLSRETFGHFMGKQLDPAWGNLLQGWCKQLGVLELPGGRCSGTSKVGPAWELPGKSRLMNYGECNKWWHKPIWFHLKFNSSL